MKYELELNTDYKSLERIKRFFTKQYEILKIQHFDSFEGIEGGASPYYKVHIEIKEEWV